MPRHLAPNHSPSCFCFFPLTVLGLRSIFFSPYTPRSRTPLNPRKAIIAHKRAPRFVSDFHRARTEKICMEWNQRTLGFEFAWDQTSLSETIEFRPGGQQSIFYALTEETREVTEIKQILIFPVICPVIMLYATTPRLQINYVIYGCNQ